MSANPDTQLSAISRTPASVFDAVKSAPSAEAVATPSSSNPEPEPSSSTTIDGGSEEDDFHPGLRLWIIIIGLGVTLLLTALENTAVTVALPIIISELELGENYIWVTNAFFISRCVPFLLPVICHI
jgi:hypothetical protein